jgi:carbamoyl-phosphate synthase small subunit
MATEAKTEAILALEDGTIHRGHAFGALGECYGEVVFNTSMTGYQEVLTDPSYRGQIVAMTYPLIGNYGINDEDFESRRPWVEGFVVRELSRVVSNWRSKKSLDQFLKENNVPGIEGVDTRDLTKHLRTVGALKAVISSVDTDPDSLIEKARKSPGLVGLDLVGQVSCDKTWEWPAGAVPHVPEKEAARQKELACGPAASGPRVAVLDYGVKYGILRQLSLLGMRPIVMPAASTAEEVMAQEPDGILLSNGPGDPEPVTYAVEAVRRLVEDPPGGRRVPIFGICMGHHFLTLALGGRTRKLKFGHHGANHPVRDERTGKVAITVQNHGFVGDADSLGRGDVEVTHMNLNDMTLEGLAHRKLPVFAVQFHPEASPGPHDAHYLFQRFAEMIRGSHA